MEKTHTRFEATYIFIILCIINCSVFFYVAHYLGYVSTEGVVRQAQVLDLFHEGSRGYESLVSSVFWSPLLSVLLLPVVPLFSFIPAGGVYCLYGCLAGAFAGVYVQNLLKELGIPLFLRFVIIVLVLCTPFVEWAPWRGSFKTFLFLFAMAGIYGYVSWLKSGQLYHITFSGLWLALAVLVDARILIFVCMAGVYLVWMLKKEQENVRGKASGMAILFLLPSVYTFGVWILLSYLVFGNPFILFQDISLLRGKELLEYALPVLVLVILVYGIVQVYEMREKLPSIHPYSIALIISMGFFLALPGRNATLINGVTGGGGSFHHRESFPKVSDYLERYKVGSVVVVSGLPGYEFTTLNDPSVYLVHTLRFEMGKVLEDNAGRDIYLLATREQSELLERRMSEGWYNMYEDKHFVRWTLYRILR